MNGCVETLWSNLLCYGNVIILRILKIGYHNSHWYNPNYSQYCGFSSTYGWIAFVFLCALEFPNIYVIIKEVYAAISSTYYYSMAFVCVLESHNVIRIWYDMHFMYKYDNMYIAHFNCSLSNPVIAFCKTIFCNISRMSNSSHLHHRMKIHCYIWFL